MPLKEHYNKALHADKLLAALILYRRVRCYTKVKFLERMEAMKMSKLYVIGNGFDLHHNLNTTYSTFGVYLKKN